MKITDYLLNKDLQVDEKDFDIEKLTKDLRKGYIKETDFESKLESSKKDWEAESKKTYSELNDKYSALEKSYNDTVGNWFSARYRSEDGNHGIAFRPLYRLDRDTSGIVLIAKNEFAAAKLAGRVKKDYYAVVCGKIEGSGVIDAPIKRERESIIKRCVAPDGESAVTHYTAIKHSEKYTLVKLKLETGRTHQKP